MADMIPTDMPGTLASAASIGGEERQYDRVCRVRGVDATSTRFLAAAPDAPVAPAVAVRAWRVVAPVREAHRCGVRRGRSRERDRRGGGEGEGGARRSRQIKLSPRPPRWPRPRAGVGRDRGASASRRVRSRRGRRMAARCPRCSAAATPARATPGSTTCAHRLGAARQAAAGSARQVRPAARRWRGLDRTP